MKRKALSASYMSLCLLQVYISAPEQEQYFFFYSLQSFNMSNHTAKNLHAYSMLRYIAAFYDCAYVMYKWHTLKMTFKKLGQWGH